MHAILWNDKRDTHENPNFAGDKAVAGERQTVEIPEHAQSGHLFQFFRDIGVSCGWDAKAAKSNDVPRIVPAS